MSHSPNTARNAMQGFTLIEVLVALVVFAAMAAITWSALGQIARARASLAEQQDRFALVVRSVGDIERDLRQALSRPLRGNYGESVPALLGGADFIELSRLGFANPRAEPRSNIERVRYELDNGTLRRNRYAVLDRAAGSVPDRRELLDQVVAWRLRYLDGDGAWRDRWPPRETPPHILPRAVEFRLGLTELGELRRVIALPATIPLQGVGSNGMVAPVPAGEAPLVPGNTGANEP